MDRCARKVWNNLPMHLAGIRDLILRCSPPFPWFPTFVLILRNMLMLRSPGPSQEGAAPLQNKSPFSSPPYGSSSTADPHSPCTKQPGGGRTEYRQQIQAVELRLLWILRILERHSAPRISLRTERRRPTGAAFSDAVGDVYQPDSPVCYCFFSFFFPSSWLPSLVSRLDVGGAGGGFVQVEHR